MNPKLVNSILLALAFVAMVIGIHRSIEESDIGRNYWIFMIGIMLYLVYNYRKRKSA
ncbi:hypothetical protein [Pontibacter roseus]|uniref:hypothetical protein n=1 Tax=Pontibacter roseus TaxID=336989 RepID=UPI00037ECBE7|nr:hypothetical protein [Pontibacter roseus]